METALDLANRLKEVLTEGHWVSGTNFKSEIQNIPWQKAVTPVANLNSIAAIVWHINYYIKGVTSVLNGDTLDIKDRYSFDTPNFNSKADWDQLKQAFFEDCNTYITLVEQLSKDELNAVFAKKKYGNYHRNINAMIEHCYYHLGQIKLIQKLSIK